MTQYLRSQGFAQAQNMAGGIDASGPVSRGGGVVRERVAWLPELGLDFVIRIDGFAMRRIKDGERFQTDTGVLTAVATPGHAPEHVCFLWTDGPAETDRSLFAGDMFMGGGDTTLVAPPEGSLTEYLASLDRLEALRPGAIHPAHGPPIADGMEAIRRYRAHRAARIEQVVHALRHGAAAPRELIDRVYGAELHPGLRGAAEGSLRAILAHLADTGRVRASGDRHHLTDI